MRTTTTLNVNLSTQLQTELSQTGVYAYAVYFDPNGTNPTWTTLSDNGTVTAQALNPAAADLRRRQGLLHHPEYGRRLRLRPAQRSDQRDQYRKRHQLGQRDRR